jgi:hypothetical protein
LREIEGKRAIRAQVRGGVQKWVGREVGIQVTRSFGTALASVPVTTSVGSRRSHTKHFRRRVVFW